MMGYVYLFVIFVMSLVSVVDNSDVTDAEIMSIYPKNGNEQHCIIVNYLCTHLETQEHEEFYTLNVTLETPFDHVTYWGSSLVDNSSNGSWYFLQNTEPAQFPIEVDVFVTYCPGPYVATTVTCTWSFDVPDATSPANEESFISTGLSQAMPTASPQTTSMSSPQATSTASSDSEVQSTEGPPNTTCLCPCACTAHMSQADMDAMKEEFIRNMRIVKTSTSKSRRILESASDKRWISRGIGGLGIIVMTIVFGSILIGDTKLFIRNARTALEHIRGRWQC